MKTRISAVTNFIYFTANFRGGYQAVIRAIWNDVPYLAEHILAKLESILGRKYAGIGVFPMGAWIDLFFELDKTNQEKMITWIELNYHNGLKHEVEIRLENANL